MGKGVTEEVLRREMKIAYISESYLETYQENLESKEYSNNEYDAYLKEHKEDYEVVDAMYFECDSEDDAKAFKKALKADGSNFAELASKYTSKDNSFEKEANKDPVETTYYELSRANFKTFGGAIAQADAHEETEEETEEEHVDTYSGLDWIFSSKRKKGDIKQQFHSNTCRSIREQSCVISDHENHEQYE